MKTIARAIFIYTFSLYLLPFIIPGVQIKGGFITLLIGGLGLALMFLIIKPILNFISLPINLITLGLFSIVTNALILYILTVFISGISIVSFTYNRTDFYGFIIPSLTFSMFFAYIYTAFVLSFIDSFFSWLVK